MLFQRIYEKALEEPAIGYDASSKFNRAPFNCPKCAGIVWVRQRTNTDIVIGFVCPACGWISTHTYDPSPKPVHVQQDLF